MANRYVVRALVVWSSIRDSLWFLPSVGVISGIVLAMVAVRIPTPDTESTLIRTWFFGGGAEGARGVLSAIAGSLITVTGVVFSVTIVALQLASSQFTPRVVGSFVADRVNQVVLAVFIGTFTYTLLVLRTIRSEADERSALVPHIAVSLALVLLLVSVAALIVFINHSARSMQASVILQNETTKVLGRVEALFPARVGEPVADALEVPHEHMSGDGTSVRSTVSGYVSAVDANTLWSLDEANSAGTITVRMELRVGTFVFPGKILATVWPASLVTHAVVEEVRNTFLIGPQRTVEQDVEFGLLKLSDIALRALSPGVNDPTTAIHCIDRLTEILAALACRQQPTSVRKSPGGHVYLLVRGTEFERALDLAFSQIRQYGVANLVISKRLLEALSELESVAPKELHATIRDHANRVVQRSTASLDDPRDRRELQQLHMSAVAHRPSADASSRNAQPEAL